jgi:L-lactate dehydrogenase complex protein LldE
MRVALFVPCYVDQLRPAVGLAALDLLEAAGCEVDFRPQATCCGQPFLTAGESRHATRLARTFLEVFRDADAEAVVVPSGSCVATVRGHLERLTGDRDAAALAARTRELCDFLDELGAGQRLPPPRRAFPRRVGLHSSCHALRELGLGTPSETRDTPRADPAARLLAAIPGLTLVDLARRDECCGFGGVFAIEEAAVSSRMGRDRLEDHARGGAEIVASSDVSCLLHLEGLARRNGPPLPMLHVAEILASVWRATDDADAEAATAPAAAG